MTGLRLFAVAALNGESHPLVADTSLVTYRDLGAVVGRAPYTRVVPDEKDLAEQHRIINAVFAHHSVLPAPAGVIFRGEDSLLRWLELHYAALADGLTFIDGRCVARLHVSDDPDVERETDVQSASTEMFRDLRREASASLPLKAEDGDTEFSAAFLLERPRWDAFAAAVAESAKKQHGVKWEITGPWPAYDFVQLKFAR